MRLKNKTIAFWLFTPSLIAAVLGILDIQNDKVMMLLGITMITFVVWASARLHDLPDAE